MSLFRTLGLAAAAACVAVAAVAAPTPAPPRPAPPPLDPKAVEAWFDATVIPAMKSSGVPGALVVVVRRDGVVISKGYGYSDVAQRVPVRADATLFDIASIGKSMTAVVTEQLLEEGKLSLDEDINPYLKSAHVTGGKVTLRMLLGHRAGFDGDISGHFVPVGQSTAVSAAELNRRLRPIGTPGTRASYDNQGYGVIALVLRDVTGKSLPQLYRERLYGPAGMRTAVWGQPTDRANLAHCYVVHGPGALRECPFWLYRESLGGAGATSASADDMAAYMRMLLRGGVAVDGTRVLSPAAYADLTNFDSYRFHPGMPGLGRSFSQFENYRGLEYAHSGHMPGFSSMMEIYPDADVAVFVSFMGGTVGSYDTSLTSILQAMDDAKVQPGAKAGMTAMNSLSDDFADHFIPKAWPRTESHMPPAPAAGDRLDDFLGDYASNEPTRSFQMRMIGWLGLLKVVRAGPDSFKVMGLGPYHHIGPYLYEDGKGNRVAFSRTAAGRFMAVHLTGGQFHKTNALESPGWSLLLFPVGLMAVLSALIQLRPRAPRRLRGLAVASLGGACLAVAALLLEWQFAVQLVIVQGAWFPALLWRLALHAGAALLAYAAGRFFLGRSEPLGRIGYIHGVIVSLGALAIVVSLLAWRVLFAFPPYVSW